MHKFTSTPTITHPEMAERLLITERFSNQRQLRLWWAEYLATQMTFGKFIPGSAIYFCWCEGKRYLVNGQHTLTGIVLSNLPVLLTFMELEVDRFEEVQAWYSRFDHILARSDADSWQALEFPQTYGFNKTETTTLNGAMKPLLSGFTLWGHTTRSTDWASRYLRDFDCRHQLMALFAEEARQFFADMSGSTQQVRTCLYRSAVFAVALVTYRYTGIDASEFWQLVAQDNGPTPDHPAKVLLHHLIGSPDRKNNKPVTARKVAAAWNAFCEERTLRNLVARPLEQPVLIIGTPYDGKQVWRHITRDGRIIGTPQTDAEDHAQEYPAAS